MSKDIWTEVDHYYSELLVKPDPRFELINQASLVAGLPSIQITPTQGKFLEMLVRLQKAKRVLEIGTLGGFSTAWLARSLPQDGNLISLEINPEHAAMARQNLSLFEFAGQIEVRVGDALDLMVELADTVADPFDLIFIDGKKSQYPDYLEASIQLSRPGTLIIADNVVKHGHIINKKIDTPSRIGITEFHQKVASEPRIQATVLQTVGEKGYDGFIFIIVNS